jgi:small subunit ribosomal protein S4
MLLKPGDVVQVRDTSKDSPKFQEIKDQAAYKTPPEWLTVDVDNLTGSVLAYPTREQIDTAVNEQLIVELYSR